MKIGIFLPVLCLTLPSLSRSQNMTEVSGIHQRYIPATYTRTYNTVLFYKQPIQSSVKPIRVTNYRRFTDNDRVVFDNQDRSDVEGSSRKVIVAVDTIKVLSFTGNGGIFPKFSATPIQGQASKSNRQPAAPNNSRSFYTNPSTTQNNNQNLSPDTVRYPTYTSNNQGIVSNTATYESPSSINQGFAAASSSSDQGFSSISSSNNQRFVPLSSSNNQGFVPVSSSNNQGFAPVSSSSNQGFAPVSSSSNQGFAPVSSGSSQGFTSGASSNRQRFNSTTSTTPASERLYTTEATTKGNEDQSANIIPNGPSRCVWAIVSCCTPSSNEVRHACFETLGCEGPFWDTNPCDRHITHYAAKAAVDFYETG